MHVCYQAFPHQVCINNQVPLPVAAWTTVTVRIDAVNNIFYVRFQGAVEFQSCIETPSSQQQAWPGMIVYASDPWHRAANAQIRGVEITPLKDMTAKNLPQTFYLREPDTIRQGEVLGRVNLPLNYILQFEVYPIGTSDHSWRSIIHMTTHHNYHKYVDDR